MICRTKPCCVPPSRCGPVATKRRCTSGACIASLISSFQRADHAEPIVDLAVGLAVARDHRDAGRQRRGLRRAPGDGAQAAAMNSGMAPSITSTRPAPVTMRSAMGSAGSVRTTRIRRPSSARGGLAGRPRAKPRSDARLAKVEPLSAGHQ